MDAPEPTAADLKLLRRGALTVRQAAEFSGLGRSELFRLMRDGDLEWFAYGERPTRLVVRKSLVRYLARLKAIHDAACARRAANGV